jgi:membrane-bound lytic murein transglycosylase D
VTIVSAVSAKPRAPRAHGRSPGAATLITVSILAGIAGCGPKPAANLDAGRVPHTAQGAEGWDRMDWGAWSTGAGDSAAADSATWGGQAEDLLESAEAALVTAGEAHAAGNTETYREYLAEAFDSLRRAELAMSEDAASFAYLRPAYEGLIADLRTGLTATVGLESVATLDASPAELARAGEVHLGNGASYDMPIDPDDPLVAKYLALFNEGQRRAFLEEAFARSNRYRAMVLEEIRKAGLPEELWVVPIVESGYKVSAYSRARAVGLWQFMVPTGRNYGLTINEWVDERRDPLKSTRAAMAYLKDLYLWFNSWDFALAAYNRGEGGIHRDIQRSRITDFMEMAELGATHTETQNHVPQIHAAAIIAKHPEKYGFQLVDEPAQMDTVVIDYVVDLSIVAECAGTTESVLRELNPELRTWVTPILSKDYPTYTLKLPLGSGEKYRTAVAQIDDKTPKRQMVYVVRKGDTLAGVARKFGVSTQDVKEWNHLRSSRLRRGQRLVVFPPKKGKTPASEATAVAANTAPADSGADQEKASSTAARSTVTHTVRRGDTLFAIAQQYNTSVDELRRLNGLNRKGKIYPGQRLKVQAGS